MLKRLIAGIIIVGGFLALPNSVWAQPTWTFDPFGKEKKPQKFEDRKLGSEKTADKKFTLPRHFLQNTITHYNYYFNANNKVNTVVEKAKISYKDDYSKLLPFYPYTLDNTAGQKTDLDSVIYTCTAGILIHDLRNDWIDNMYLLIGKAYFFRKEFDSAAMTFQFINFNLFPRKKNEDDSRIVGTNSAAIGSSISIANKEKRNIIQKIVSLPPSRNDALIWLARTQIELNEFGEAGSLINILQNDPNLPKRLRNDLDEVSSYWFYKQAGFDSAATHLEKALSTADTKQDKSRWEFLLGQLYEMNGQYEKASSYYAKAAKHTVDPLMDIYARLNDAKMLKGTGNPKELAKNIDNLLKMARRDKFEAYRDIIYFSAGQLSLQIPDTASSIIYFRKSLKYNETNTPFKNKAFLQLADIAYTQRQYRQAASLYDSLLLTDSTLKTEMARIESRKNALTRLVDAITKIEKEDSLQHIASMPPAERDAFIKKILRKLRKEKGLKDDGSYTGGDIIPFNNNNQPPTDLFATNTKGEWYFYNSSLKSKGFNEFKSKWGNRTNTDNWRRKAAAELPNNNNTVPVPGDVKNKTKTNPKDNVANNQQPGEITYESLLKDLPLTDEKIKQSNDILAESMVDLAKIYQNELDEFELAANTYEDYLKRFPERLLDGEIYLGLYFCYTKLGNTAKAAYYKNLLNTKFRNSISGQMMNNPASLNPKTKDPAATKLYEDIYQFFIEGDFDKAITEKKKADGLYGLNYWTPQLLYIEALYYVRQRNDSVAIGVLGKLIAGNPSSPLKSKAQTMIDVLRRRAEIENYLTNLQITRDTENNIIIPADKPVAKKPVVVPVMKDSVKKSNVPLVSGPFTMALSAPHVVLMVLEKVDPVYINEAKNAFTRYNTENFYGQSMTINKDMLDAEHNLLVITGFADAATALQYYDKIKKAAGNEVSWLPANKYSFLIITNDNLQLLKTNKNIAEYKKLLNTQFPGRF